MDRKPTNNLVFSLDLRLLKALQEMDRVAIEEFDKKWDKKVDTLTSPVQNKVAIDSKDKIKTMKNTTFALGVLTAVGLVRQNGNRFSQHDVTRKMRELINTGELVVIDRQSELVDGLLTIKVDHDEVKQIFAILMENGIVTNLGRRFNGTYNEYWNESALVSVSGSLSPLQQAAQSVSQQVQVTPSLAGLHGKLKDYLSNRSGENITMKRIQSRFDRERQRVCQDYATLAESLGFIVDKSSPSPSRWFVPAQGC